MSEPERAVSRRGVLAGAAAVGGVVALTAGVRRAAAQTKPTITYWNGMNGADGKVMDELIQQFTQETGIKIEQQRIPWADLYANLQVSLYVGAGPKLALLRSM